MKKLLLLMPVIFLLVSCAEKKPKQNTEEIKFLIMENDRDFSRMSEQRGVRKAFLEYIDSNAVLLRPNTMPMAGGDCMDFISKSNDTAFTMTWEPKNAHVSLTGDMGFTYGVYSVKPNETDTAFYGTYVTIWKKQPNGKWKFVLQSGNEGVQ
jgi:ketosteroid isomerase-like protein